MPNDFMGGDFAGQGDDFKFAKQTSKDAVPDKQAELDLLLEYTLTKADPAVDPSISVGKEKGKNPGKTSIFCPSNKNANLIFGSEKDLSIFTAAGNAAGGADSSAAAKILWETHGDIVRSALGKIWTNLGVKWDTMSQGDLIFLSSLSGLMSAGAVHPADYRTETGEKLDFKLPLINPQTVTVSVHPAHDSTENAAWVDDISSDFDNDLNAHIQELKISQVGFDTNSAMDSMVSLGLHVHKDLQAPVVWFEDHVTAYGSPFSLVEMLKNNMPRPLYYDYNSRYNYYEKSYENIATSNNTKFSEFLWNAGPDYPNDIENLFPDINTAILEEAQPTNVKKIGTTFAGGAFEEQDRLEDYVSTHSDEYGSVDDLIEKGGVWSPYHKFVTLFNRIKDVFVDILREVKVAVTPGSATYKIKMVKVGEGSSGQYYQKWARAVNKAIDTGNEASRQFFLKLLREHRNVVFSPFALKAIKDREEAKFLFPMYNEVEFGTDTKTELADSISHTSDVTDKLAPKLYYFFIKSILEAKRSHAPHKETFAYTKDNGAVMLSAATRDAEAPTMAPREEFSSIDSFRLAGWSTPGTPRGDSWRYIFAVNGSEAFDQYANRWHMFLDDLSLGVHNTSMPDTMSGEAGLLVKFMLQPFREKIHSMMVYKGGKGPDVPSNVAGSGKTRSFKEIINGDLAYSETLFYRVAKYRVAPNGSLYPTSTFYFPNTNEIDVLKFIDTQIKYNTEYVYKIYAWQVIFGTEYRYELGNMHAQAKISDHLKDIEFEGQTASQMYTSEEWIEKTIRDSKTLNLTVHTRPSVKVFEIPYVEKDFNFEIKTKAIDYSPLPPEIKIIPYKGVNNKILINLNASVGEAEVWPHNIGPLAEKNPEGFDIEDIITTYGDSILEDYMYQYLKPKDLGGGNIYDAGGHTRPIMRAVTAINHHLPITFRTDDIPYSFYYLRLSNKPAAYSDFKDAKVDELVVGNATSYSLVDDILPNKKYYYIFMTKDIHNGVSFPSPVYEVEMVDQEGMVYPLINIFELEPIIEIGHESKPAKKYIHIMPALEQALLREQASIPWELYNGTPGDYDSAVGANPYLGQAEETIFNDKKYTFKVRLVSKKTGKKIDLNFMFDSEHTVTEKEQNSSQYVLDL